MRPVRLTAALAAALLMSAAATRAAPARACAFKPEGAADRTATSARFALALRPAPAPIVVGEPFALEILVCPLGAAVPDRVTVDATMPEHRHGMNYAPSVTAKGAGRYRAEGLLLHMPGRWQLAIEIRAGGSTDVLTSEVVLP